MAPARSQEAQGRLTEADGRELWSFDGTDLVRHDVNLATLAYWPDEVFGLV